MKSAALLLLVLYGQNEERVLLRVLLRLRLVRVVPLLLRKQFGNRVQVCLKPKNQQGSERLLESCWSLKRMMRRRTMVVGNHMLSVVGNHMLSVVIVQRNHHRQ